MLIRIAPLLLVLAAALLYGADGAAASLLLSALLLGCGALIVLLSPRRPPVLALAFALAFIGFAAVGWMKGWLASGGPEYAALAAVGAVYLSAFLSANTAHATDRLWRMTLLAGGLLAGAAVIDHLLNPDLSFGRPRPYHEGRLAAPFLSANTAATFYATVMLMAAGEALRRFARVSGFSFGRIFEAGIQAFFMPGLVFLFAASALVLTASRGGIAIGAVCLLVLVAWERLAAGRRFTLGGLAGGAGLAGAVLLGLFFMSGDAAFMRFESGGSDNSRLRMFASYWPAAREAGAFGHGLGGFSFVNDALARGDEADFLQVQGAAHSVYLQWLIQGGWAGATMMGAAFVSALGAILTGLGRRARQRSYLRTLFIIAVMVCAHGAFDYALEIPMMAWWTAWLLGLGGGLALREERGA